MDKVKITAEQVRINYHIGKSKYFVLTDKTGYPSAEFRSRFGSGLIVPYQKNSSADPPG
ncbi:MAG: hypothetical protein ACOY46_19570 [Bacillota bacterium]